MTIKLTLVHGDCMEVLPKIADKSIDLVLTDPPYGINYGKVVGDENLDTFLNFIPLAFRVLRNDKFFITYCSPKFIYEVIGKAKEVGFEYLWIGFNYYPNMFKQKPQPLGYNRHDTFLIFGKGEPKKSAFMKDVIHIVMDKNKPKHPHEKPIKAIEKLIKCASNEGDTVLDPFLGSGTTMHACLELNRNCIGVEINPKYINITKKRLNWGHSLGDVEFEFYVFEKP